MVRLPKSDAKEAQAQNETLPNLPTHIHRCVAQLLSGGRYTTHQQCSPESSTGRCLSSTGPFVESGRHGRPTTAVVSGTSDAAAQKIIGGLVDSWRTPGGRTRRWRSRHYAHRVGQYER